MRAAARIVAVAGDGGTRLAAVRSEPPLVVRRTGPHTVHLVGGAAGPLGGDRLRVDVEVGAGARLCVRTVAASLALPGAGRSVLEVYATVADGGRLDWLPEPLIAARGCDHLSRSTVELSENAALAWREELVCGRHGEAPGDARMNSTVRYAGRTLLRQDVAVGPGAAGWDGPAVLGGGRTLGSLLLVDPQWREKPPDPAVLGPSAALMPLAGPAALVTATGADLRGVRAVLDPTVIEASFK